MELHAVAEVAPPLAQAGRRRQELRETRAVRVEHDEKADLLPLRAEPLRHLPGHEPAEGGASEVVRAVGLQLADLLDVVSGHLLDGIEARHLSVEALRLDPVERLLRVEVAAEVLELEDVPADPMDAVEGRAGSAGRIGTSDDQRGFQPSSLRSVARRSIVGASRSVTSGRLRPVRASIRPTIRTALNDSPPRSKKLSFTPMGAEPKTSSHTLASWRSSVSRGATRLRASGTRNGALPAGGASAHPPDETGRSAIFPSGFDPAASRMERRSSPSRSTSSPGKTSVRAFKNPRNPSFVSAISNRRWIRDAPLSIPSTGVSVSPGIASDGTARFWKITIAWNTE